MGRCGGQVSDISFTLKSLEKKLPTEDKYRLVIR